MDNVTDYTLTPEFPLNQQQQLGVEFVLKHKFSLVNLQTGVGKTLLILTAAEHIHKKATDIHTVIVCPNEAIKAFIRELRDKLKVPFNLYTAEGVETQEGARYHIFTYSSLKNYTSTIHRLSRKYRLIGIVDEIHALQNEKTKQYKLIMSVQHCFKARWGMTATPLISKTHIHGLYNIISFLYPGYLSSWTDFKTTFCVTKMEKIKLRNKMERFHEVIVELQNIELLRSLLEKIMIVGSITYNLNWHWHKTRISPEEFEYYRQAGRGALEGKERKGFAERLHDLQQIIDNSHPSLPSDLQKTVSMKEKLLLVTLRELLNQNGIPIIFVEHYNTVDRLKKVLDACKNKNMLTITDVFCLTGRESKKERDAVEEKMTSQSIIIATRAGTQSRNLQKSNQVVFYDIPFSIAQFLQAIGRITRYDSQHPEMHIHMIEAWDTIDTYKRMLVQDNAATIEALFGNNPNLPDIKELDRSGIRDIRRKILWSFRKKARQNP
jgi:superfamily II DNA or RNA helicase